ncbi:kinase-like domain-containing protein [Xylariaceae sp. FL0255]|nr:kinase-like domain-containing protein [Xylariaceae sp. FL0255]
MANSSRNADELYKHLQKNFDGQYWQCVKVLGTGLFGFVILLTQKDSPHRHMAVKLAKKQGVDQLRQEIQILREVNGAKHIVSILGFCDDLPTAIQARRRRAKGTGRLTPQSAFDSFLGFEGPALGLEYLEHGTLRDLQRKLQETYPRKEIPNRVLWSLLYCLFRASHGLAFPIGANIGSPSKLETASNSSFLWPIAILNPRIGRTMGYAHNDLHTENVMLTRSESEEEHMLTNTIAKVIDLGLANRTVTAATDNVWNAASAMLQLITQSKETEEGIYLGKVTDGATLLYPGFNSVDKDLRNLVMRCLWRRDNDRPTLQQASDEARKALRDRRPDSFPDPARETDEYIFDFMQQYLFDAGVDSSGFILV